MALREFLTMLKKQEGGKLHRNKNEEDITTGYGIYRHARPKAEIWKYIDSLGNGKPSNTWTDSEIKEVNSKINEETEIMHTLNFYKTYFRIDVEALPRDIMLSYCSLYTTSPKIADKSLQNSINHITSKFFPHIAKIGVDGVAGKGTMSAIEKLVAEMYKHDHKVYKELWNICFLSYVKTEYVAIATDGGKEDKHLPFLKGWINRVDSMD